MSLKVACECGMLVVIDSQHIGQTIRCPGCKRAVSVTGPLLEDHEGSASAEEAFYALNHDGPAPPSRSSESQLAPTDAYELELGLTQAPPAASAYLAMFATAPEPAVPADPAGAEAPPRSNNAPQVAARSPAAPADEEMVDFWAARAIRQQTMDQIAADEEDDGGWWRYPTDVGWRIAAALVVLNVLLGLVTSAYALASSDLAAEASGPTYDATVKMVLGALLCVLIFMLAILGLMTAYGLWSEEPWAAVLTAVGIIVTLISLAAAHSPEDGSSAGVISLTVLLLAILLSACGLLLKPQSTHAAVATGAGLALVGNLAALATFALL